MEKITDGWRTVGGYDCWVEDGKVLRAVIEDADGRRTGYTYRADRVHGGWDRCTVTVAALRAGLRRGTIVIR